MKGYVNVTKNEKTHEALVAFMKKANDFKKNYDVKTYSVVERVTHLFRKATLKTVLVSRDSIQLPEGVFCHGYVRVNGIVVHSFCLDYKGKAVKQIIELFKNNDTIMLDGEMATVYNSFTN